METTERLALPLLIPGQAQKELVHNEALVLLDTIVAGAVEGPAANDPPVSPTTGSCYIVGPVPTGDWSDHANHLAAFTGAGWRFVQPVAGLSVTIKPSAVTAIYGLAGWEVGTVRADKIVIGGQQVVGSQAGAIAGPAGGAVSDVEARFAVDQILAALRIHGLIAAE